LQPVATGEHDRGCADGELMTCRALF
jgi:hypothetical protein